ncbi:O-antigen ligase family protein [Rhizobium rhizophilum]|uniref:O-antigen ligase family protein n=1 Tax=Rhizobium rhizophilum TaxID=1850373 RepID=UPI00145629FD|nr:O-antigen ligase family protein [Rhizobium rhizophilum]
MKRTMNENNLVAIYLVFGLAALGGSVVTILLAASAVWAILYLSFGKIACVWRDGTRLFTLAILVYVLVNLVFFGLNFGQTFTSPLLEIKKLAPQILFLGAIPVMMRLSLSSAESLLRSVPRAAAVGAILVLPLAAYQAFALGERAEGGSGNAIPFALTCAFLSVASLITLLEEDRRLRLLGICGFFSGYLCIFLSQTKGLMPIPLIGLALVLAQHLRHKLRLGQVLAIGLAVCAFVAIGIYASGSHHRLKEIAVLTGGASDAALSQSTTVRLDLWDKALTAFAQKPVTGHGLQNRRALIQEFGYGYSHLHNGYITALVDNGVIGLLALGLLMFAPLFIALRAPKDALHAPRLLLALALVLTYAFGGLTNLIFGHDIYDALFLWVGLVIAVSATPKASDDVEGSA